MTDLVNPFFVRPSGPPPISLPAFRYWHIHATGHNANTNWDVREIEMAATPGGADICNGGTALGFAMFNSPTFAFDNNLGTQASTTFNSPEGWIGYDFGSPVTVAEVRIRSHSANIPINLVLRYSSDGTNWFTFAHLLSPGWGALEDRTWTFSSSLALLSDTWRMFTEYAENGGRSSLIVTDLAFAATIGGANLATGGAALVFSESTMNAGSSGGGTPASVAFDGLNTTNVGRTNFARFILGYTFPSPVSIKQMRFTSSNATNVGNVPRDLQLQIPDGSNVWRTVGALWNQAGWASLETRAAVVP